MVSVRVRRQAISGMIRSAYELYRRETYGLLVGRKSLDRYTLDYVSPFQRANNMPTNVELSMREISRTGWTADDEEIIGYYHSHTSYWNSEGITHPSTSPSHIDIDDHIDDLKDGRLLSIIAFYEGSRRRKCRLRDKKISGSIRGDRLYSIDIVIYYHDKRLRRADISFSDKDLAGIFL